MRTHLTVRNNKSITADTFQELEVDGKYCLELLKNILLGVNLRGMRPSKNFSFWTALLDLDAIFKIKLLLYKDLILNSLSAMLMGNVEKVINF